MANLVDEAAPQLKLPDHEKNHFEIDEAEAEEVNDNPIEQVRLTVPITDDPTQAVLTIRTWVLGLAACILLSFVNQFFQYRSNQLSIGSVTIQILVLPIGKYMAAKFPEKTISVPFTKWSFSLNPGPFNMKEHVLITIFANCGAGGVYAVYIVTIIKAFYHRGLHPVAAMLLAQTTQLLGYGWAGTFRKILVDSPYMWWPSTLIQVSLFRALHEKEKRKKGERTRLQFFAMVFVASFAYYIVPGHFFPSLSALSFVCWIWKRSITAQQIGSGLNGLGIGSFGLDWATVASFLGTPLAYPFFAIVNTMVGFILVMYVLVPIAYWSNFREAKRFPIFSSHTFDHDGQRFNITRVLNDKTFDLNLSEYENYSKLYLSIFFAFIYGLSFASLTATLTHVALFDGKNILKMWKKTTTAVKDEFSDVHTRIMKKNYAVVPQWWFTAILVISVALSLVALEGFDHQLQLPWWGLLLACFIALIFTLPVGVVQATTNMQIGLNVITELVIGYMYPGKPVANVAFKTYGYISMTQALSFLGDFKIGHYMKIPPKSMFIVQHGGSSHLLKTSAIQTCFLMGVHGLVLEAMSSTMLQSSGEWWGPLRMFTDKGVYPEQNWWFLIGFLAPIPVWFLQRKFPEKKWIKLTHVPLILSATSAMPSAKTVHYWSWAFVGFVFNFIIYRRYKGWWAKHTYILSAALDAGVAFLGVILYFALQSRDIYGPSWWGADISDHCPLAKCPTAPGITVKGCPVF
ncbi:ISP4 LIKE PROTEIN [Salix koriyanagi]|uniref:ISP4 LIKE PROTEIN n=1 Tax=Salix koriyanagi TaxID=2511006 RepID=A0A9Q0X0Y9_9ROSI|nr:ISP4 LIKE PROTEIN [Salix koriyanagi]